MTLNLLGIAAEETDNPQPPRKDSPLDQFWMAAGEVLIEIVKLQPDIQPILDAAIEAGDIEITAHNQGNISFALADPSGLRHVLLADARQLLQ
jgi:hypothetical protein